MAVFYCVLVAVIAVTCFIVFRSSRSASVTLAGLTIIAALLAPWGVYSATAAVAKNNDQTFQEFWNGSEVSATANATTCTRDGSCNHTYNCDPYITTSVQTYTDSKGKTQTRLVTQTDYHHCPYSTQETSYSINTTVGNFTVASAVMTGDPYRGDTPVPGGKQTTPPQAWLDAKARIDSGNPGGATSLHPYKNYVLASDATLFKTYSDKIDTLLGQHLLPTPAASVTGDYHADKAYSAGATNIDMGSMNTQLAKLDGRIGTEMQGDMHIVFADSAAAGDPTDYTNALKAYWTSPKIGKNQIAKNTLTLVVGVAQQGGKPVVDWARGFTGMPTGNEALLQDFTNLKGTVIDGNFIGSPKFNPATKTYTPSNGVVENMVTGAHKFVRQSMTGNNGANAGSGFSYLSDDWQMPTGALTIAILISSIISVIILGVGMFFSVGLGETEFPDPLRALFSPKKK